MSLSPDAIHHTQPRPIPQRVYEPNILHNPFLWMGIWTPHGWRVHPKRYGRAERFEVQLSGDGKTTFFPGALCDPATGRVGWQDDLHLSDDPYTDTGHYPCDPRIEYPIDRPRWAISHTLLCYPVADHTLYTHEYTWDMTHGHLQTHFRRRVEAEPARTGASDGLHVDVAHRPLSRVIEGNVQYELPNSAVRGVWADPQKQSMNLYARRVVELMPMHNAIYGLPRHHPVLQVHGIWPVLETDPLDELFNADTGECRDRQGVIDRMHIPLDSPKISLLKPVYRERQSKVYEGPLLCLGEHERVIDRGHVDELRRRLGARFVMGKVGYTHATETGNDTEHYAGYGPQFDYNDDGVIDEEDLDHLQHHLGRTVRQNVYVFAYFGGDWITSGIGLDPEHPPGIPVVVDYTCGAGYDAVAGRINLFESPGPDQQVWVEYHYDTPAEAGTDNIRLMLYRELDEGRPPT